MKLIFVMLGFILTPFLAIASDTVWYNGHILTMDDKRPEVEAVAVRDGKIIALGTESEVLKRKKAGTTLVDLQHKTLMPGFVDAHGHVTMVGLQAMSANLLPPPDGPNASIAELQKTLREFIKTSPNPKKFGVLIGFGYDDASLKEHRHPNRAELDQVSTAIPIVIMHQSGHFGVLNSKALALANLTKDSKNPGGGVIRKMGGSKELSGVLEENAFFGAMAKVMPKMTQEQSIEMLEAGQDLYLSYGYTTIQDGRTSPDQVRIGIEAAKAKRLKADIVSYPDILMPGMEEVMKAPYYHDVSAKPSYQNRFRVGGAKITLDGSPQGRTAWLIKPYYKPPEGQKQGYAGYGVVTDQVAIAAYEKALKNHWQILTHANGDRAIDQMISALKTAENKFPNVDVRPVLIHGQFLRQDQVPLLKELKIIPSLFTMHTFYWGDWYRSSVLGPTAAENISPTGWVLQQGMRFTVHHDAPVAYPDSIRVLASTVNRTTRSGYVLGPDQRVEPLIALKAMTIWPAFQHWEENSKGSIEVGKLADFVVLSENPLTFPKKKLMQIKVMETIKEGKTVYSRPQSAELMSGNF
jgi:predicted amidohydrolase YtcJ